MKRPYEPCLPTNAITVPTDSEWLHELKHDGFRLTHARMSTWTATGCGDVQACLPHGA
jgi:ATP-dependent DNA ligase